MASLISIGTHQAGVIFLGGSTGCTTLHTSQAAPILHHSPIIDDKDLVASQIQGHWGLLTRASSTW